MLVSVVVIVTWKTAGSQDQPTSSALPDGRRTTSPSHGDVDSKRSNFWVNGQRSATPRTMAKIPARIALAK